MEIDVTAFFENADPFEFSHSRAEGWDAYEADDSLTHNIFKAGNDKIYYSLSP